MNWVVGQRAETDGQDGRGGEELRPINAQVGELYDWDGRAGHYYVLLVVD